MTHDRDLFRAIVISGAAVAAGCSTPAPTIDAANANDAGSEDAAMVADATTTDANEPVDAAMPTDAPEDDGFVAII